MRTTLALVVCVAFLIWVTPAEAGERRGGVRSGQGHVICHQTSGDPDDAITITVKSWLSVWLHMLHGDTMGPCPEPPSRTAVLFVGHGDVLPKFSPPVMSDSGFLVLPSSGSERLKAA